MTEIVLHFIHEIINVHHKNVKISEWESVISSHPHYC